MCSNIEIGPIFINTYYLMMILGIIAAAYSYVMFVYKRQKDKVIFFKSIAIYLTSISIGSVGNKLFYTLEYIDSKKAGGVNFFGTILLGTAVFLLLCKIFIRDEDSHMSQNIHFNAWFFSLAIQQIFNRMGCFFEGCCFGVKSDSILAVWFPYKSAILDLYGAEARVLPIQLFEVIILISILIVLSRLIKKQVPISAIGLFLYGICRFIIEFFRAGDRGYLYFNHLSLSQMACLLLVTVGLFNTIAYFYSSYKNKINL